MKLFKLKVKKGSKIKIKTREDYGFNLLQRRIIIGVVSFCFMFVALLSRLFYVQIIDGKELQKMASLAWARSLPLNAKRGEIYDINKIPLAVSISTYDVYSKAVNVNQPEKTALRLAQILDLDYETVLTKVKSRKTSEVLIKMQISELEAKKIIESKLGGIYLTENLERVYPFGDLLTQILGYTSIDNSGQTGIELFYDKYLKGLNGKNVMPTDASGHELENSINYYIPAISGLDITLTIDSEIQIILENILSETMELHKAKGALGIIMDSKTGEIIAYSNKPSFNLNEPMRDNLDLLNSLSKNQAVSDVYEPGSTFKLFTTSAALEEGVVKLDSQFYDPGFRIVDGQRIKCWKTIGHGQQTLVNGVVNSCNSVFMDLGLRLGTEKLYEYLKKFGIGSKTGIDFFGETSGLMLPEKDVKNVDLARIAFGHTVAVSALQLVSGVNSVINGGTLYKPQLLKEVRKPDGTLVHKTEPVAIRQTISKDTSDKMRYMMMETVKHSNAIWAYVPGYSLGGKTGTAQKYGEGGIAQGKYVSSFVGFAPYDDPKYTLLLLVDEPSTGAYYGSVVAAPAAKKVYEQIFDTKKISPTGNVEEEQKRFALNITIPNLVGKSITEAQKILNEIGLTCEIEGAGGIVHSQYPGANLKAFSGAVVVISC